MVQKKASSSGSGFKYRPRSPEQRRARLTMSGGNREGFIVEGVKVFSPKAGSHSIRIMPPTWEDAGHYGFDVYAHYNIGPDGSSFLCLKKMKNEDCPICDERARASREGDEELSDALKWRRRVACYIIDRDAEKEGPQLWFMPQSLDTDIMKISEDKKTGEVYNFDDPEEGYDISFEREGQGLNTKYVGIVIDRRSSPLHDDEDVVDRWREFIEENPIPELLVFRSVEELEDLVGDGLSAPKDARKKSKDDDKPTRARSRRDEEDEEDEKPKRRAAKDEEDEEDEKPKRRSRIDEDEEEEPKKRKARDEEEDEEPPKKRSKDEEDEEDEKPRPRVRKRDDDEDEEKARPGAGMRARLDTMRKKSRD